MSVIEWIGEYIYVYRMEDDGYMVDMIIWFNQFYIYISLIEVFLYLIIIVILVLGYCISSDSIRRNDDSFSINSINIISNSE